MGPSVARLIGPAAASLRTVVSDRDLARLEVAWLAVNIGKWAFIVTSLVIVYEGGGPVAVGVLGLARYLTPMLLSLVAGLPTARWAPASVLVASNAIRTLAVALAAVVVALDAPIEFLFLTVALEAGAGAFTRPLHMALLPSVARTPDQLVAANVVSSAGDGLGTFLGPVVSGLLLAAAGPTGANLGVVAIYALGVAAIAGLRVPVVGRSDGSIEAARAQLMAGIRTVAHELGPRLIVIGLAIQTFVRGLLIVLTVVAAIDLLGMGEAGVGALNAAMGAGGFVGAVLAITLTGRSRLTPAFALALAGWGAPIALIGLVAEPIVALAAMVAVGTCNSVLDVAGYTLAQRTAPNRSRVAVLGLIDAVANAGTAAGGIAAPILLELLGMRGALLGTGLILPIAAVLLWPGLRRVDEGVLATAPQTVLLRADPLFAPLSLATVEHLASVLAPVEYEDGTWLMREGEPGDHYVLIQSGEVEVIQDGRRLRSLGPGGGIGEIALLRDVPRTASVRARGPVTGFTLARPDFLEAVTGHPESRATAAMLVEERLAFPGTRRP